MKPPLSVIAISALYLVAGTVGLIYHFPDLKDPDDKDAILVLVVRLLAVIGGIFTLRGSIWARWLLVGWIAYHVGLSFYHSFSEVAVHVAFLALTVLALFNKKANAFFKR